MRAALYKHGWLYVPLRRSDRIGLQVNLIVCIFACDYHLTIKIHVYNTYVTHAAYIYICKRGNVYWYVPWKCVRASRSNPVRVFRKQKTEENNLQETFHLNCSTESLMGGRGLSRYTNKNFMDFDSSLFTTSAYNE